MSNVLVISTSLHNKSNSDFLAERLVAGARDAGHQVECISMKGKNVQFCRGCPVHRRTIAQRLSCICARRIWGCFHL